MTRAALLLMALAGCASPYAGTWTRPDATHEDFRREAAQCRNEGRRAAAAERYGEVGLVAAQATYRDCMIGKGWTFTR